MAKKTKGMKIGVLTAGGDCPGLNAAIRGVGKTAIVEHGMEVYGFSEGFRGVLDKDYIILDEKHLSGILTVGGTILGTSREKPFKKPKNGNRASKKPEIIKKHYEELGLDCLVCIGGNGTMETATLFAEQGLNVIGIPKTIDNDVWGTEQTFGFDSAMNIATEAIDRLHSTANSHKRIMVIEIMGHNAGWLALHSGLAAGGDVILIPEIPYDINVVVDYLNKRVEKEKPYSIVVVAEGISTPNKRSAAQFISEQIQYFTAFETRQTILGYIQRGGTPSPFDRLLATSYGARATELISQGEFNQMVALQNNKITSIPLKEVGGKVKTVPENYSLITHARHLDTCFGDDPKC